MVNNQKRISAIFSALSDPTRRRILVRLSCDGEGPVSALAEPFRISPPAISRHLRVLERAKLIGRRREGRSQVIRARLDGLGWLRLGYHNAQRAGTSVRHAAGGRVLASFAVAKHLGAKRILFAT